MWKVHCRAIEPQRIWNSAVLSPTEQIKQTKWLSLCKVPPVPEGDACPFCGLCTDGAEHWIHFCPSVAIIFDSAFQQHPQHYSIYERSEEPTAPALFVAMYHLACEHVKNGSTGCAIPSMQTLNKGIRSIVNRWWHMLDHDKRSPQAIRMARFFGVSHQDKPDAPFHNANRHDTCKNCQTWKCNHIQSCTVGKGIRANCARVDYQRKRWVATELTPTGQYVLHYPVNETYHQIRQAQIGCEYNLESSFTTCPTCGTLWKGYKALRLIHEGQEVAVSATGTTQMQSTLLIAWDGGGRKKDGRGNIGCGVVAFVHTAGKTTEILSAAIPLPQAESAQEAEAAGVAAILCLYQKALDIAEQKFPKLVQPDIFVGDSKNTIGHMTGESRYKSHRITQWMGGVREALAINDREIEFKHIPRAMNQEADRLATLACNLSEKSLVYPRP